MSKEMGITWWELCLNQSTAVKALRKPMPSVAVINSAWMHTNGQLPKAAQPVFSGPSLRAACSEDSDWFGVVKTSCDRGQLDHVVPIKKCWSWRGCHWGYKYLSTKSPRNWFLNSSVYWVWAPSLLAQLWLTYLLRFCNGNYHRLSWHSLLPG
jgi:hypothetical protein